MRLNLMPLLMSRVNQSTLINIFDDRSFVCGNHFIMKVCKVIFFLYHYNLRRSNNCKVEVLEMGQLVDSFYIYMRERERGLFSKLFKDCFLSLHQNEARMGG